MPITSTNTFTLTTIQSVVIDCSALHETSEPERDVASLIGWVRTVPQRSSVRVTLKSATGNGLGRKLRGAFQALGCTVLIQTRI